MAGIAGIIGKPDRNATEQMLETMKHRGPDTRNLHANGAVAVGVTAPELSPQRGSGFAADGKLAVLFDGEIYNDRADGQSDADVVLDLYRKCGNTFGSHLEGVFACAVVDGDDVVLARDTVGVRPLYWGHTADGEVVFASELKALVGLAKDVQELPPSTVCSTGTGVAAYVPKHPDVEMPAKVEEAVRKVRETMMESVRRRIEDGAVGACLLSGGLDSSIIACAAYELGWKGPLITVGMEGAPDIENAVIVAKHLDAEHHVLHYTADEIADQAAGAVYALESFDEDCVSGAISNLFASAGARKHTNCILSGEGGDELFGGYHLLKELPTEAERMKMMQRLIEIAYNTALQRLDRAMMGNGITYRTPFIDSDVVALALQLPVQWKIRDVDGAWIEKWILREAFKDLLPEKIYKRVKLRFAGGTGTDGVMDRIAEGKIDAKEFNDETRHTPEGYTLSSPKELWYYRIFKEKFPGPQFERLVGRWDPGK